MVLIKAKGDHDTGKRFDCWEELRGCSKASCGVKGRLPLLENGVADKAALGISGGCICLSHSVFHNIVM